MQSISEAGEGLGEEAGRFILNQLLTAISFCHNTGITHQDIKLENILINKSMNIKLIDFGLSQDQNNDKLKVAQGTAQYMSPQIHAR